MNWVLQRLLGAVIAGVGWKIGSDAYEALKKRFKDRTGGDAAEENGVGVAQTDGAAGGPDPHRARGES